MLRKISLTLIVACLLSLAGWAAPAVSKVPTEVEWLTSLAGVKLAEKHKWDSAWEGRYELTGDGYATMEKIRIRLTKQGWTVKDQDRSSGGVLSRRLDSTRGKLKLGVTATQQNGQVGRMMVGLQGK